MPSLNHNLEQLISEWRQQMLSAGVKSPVPLDELEEHLRSDVEQQIHSGTDVDTAFSNAVARIGTASRLREEFKKARPRSGIAFEKWFTAGAALLVVSTLVASAVLFRILQIGIIQQIFGLAGVGVILLVACGGRYFLPHVPVLKNRLAGFGLYVLFFALAFLCPATIAGLVRWWIDPSSTTYVIAMIWVAVPMPALCWMAQAFIMDSNAREKWGMVSADNDSNSKTRYV